MTEVTLLAPGTGDLTSPPFILDGTTPACIYLIPLAPAILIPDKAFIYLERIGANGTYRVLTLTGLEGSVAFYGVGEFQLRRTTQGVAVGATLVTP